MMRRVAACLAVLGADAALAQIYSDGPNITISTWRHKGAHCQGKPDKEQHILPFECVQIGDSRSKMWVKLRCVEDTGWLGDYSMDVMMETFGDPHCARQPEQLQERPSDTCFDVLENELFYEEMMFTCGDGRHRREEIENPWPFSSMSLMVAAVLLICIFGHCQASARGRRRQHYRPRPAVRRSALRPGASDSIYDPSAHPSYGAVARLGEGEGGGDDGGSPGLMEVELTPEAAALVAEWDKSAPPTMQQVTQMVLRASSVPPSEKRHTMMMLFRHYGYAGGSKPPASDHPQAAAASPSPPPPADVEAGTGSGSDGESEAAPETAETPLLPGGSE